MKHFFIILLFISNFCIAQMTAPKLSKERNETKNPSNDTTENLTTTNKDKKVIFYGLTALNSSNENLADNLTATGRLAVQINLASNVIVNVGANLLNANPTKGVKKDSIDFNSLMFPETGNFGFLFNPTLRLFPGKIANGHSLHLDATYAYRRIALDSPSVSFKINSVNIGLRYTWSYNPGEEDNNFTFSLMPYWNLFNIPDEDVKKFDILLNDPLFLKTNTKAEIYSIGLKTVIQYKTFLFFADLRRNIKTNNLDDDNPFKGTKFNIGFATSVKLKSF